MRKVVTVFLFILILISYNLSAQNIVITEALGVIGLVLVMSKGFCLFVKFIETSICNPYPQIVFFIFKYRQDKFVTEAPGIIRLVLITGEGFCFSIESI